MPTIRIASLLLLAAIMSGCGSSGNSGPNNINGQWFASLTDSNGNIDYSFSVSFSQGMGSGLNITNFTFTIPGPCFAAYGSSEYAESGSFTFSGNSNGQLQGTFSFTITTLFPAVNNNVLTLMGNANGSKISGNWSATGGTGCSGSGTFTLQPPQAGG